MYWRGVVMWRCNGMEWQAPYSPRARSSSSAADPTGAEPPVSSARKEIEQRITLPANGTRWMFALDRPIKAVPGAMLARGDYLYSNQPIRKSRRYDVVSSEFRDNEITARERAEALDVPASLTPAVRDLARSW